MDRVLDRRGQVAVGCVLTVVLAFAVVLEAKPLDATGLRALDDVVQAVAAFGGASVAAWRASRSRGRLRISWAMFAAGLASWACGQVVWSYYEVIAERSAPFPSLADVGYLLFPVLALAALLVRPSSAFFGRGRFRVLLDGAMVAGALFNVSWATTLGEVYRDGADSTLAQVVGMAYPLEDLVVLAVALMVLVHARERTGLLLVTLGIVGMAVADSAFVYLTATNNYSTGNPVDIAWVSAFLLIGLAAFLDSGRTDSATESRVWSPSYLVLPYVLVALGCGVVAVSGLRGDAEAATVVVAAVEVLALLARQYLLVLDNRGLVLQSRQHQTELLHRALHDPLTGLANRTLFTEQVGHALELHRRTGRPLAVIFCDLDDFKAVNDTLGHDAGDALLVAVAQRFLATARASDTVARLGGDEFGVLIEEEGDVEVLAHRMLVALAEPIEMFDRQLRVHASIGVATVAVNEPAIDGQELLKRADVAMYAAKRSGKFTVAAWTPELRDLHVDDLDLQLALAAAVTAGSVRVALQPVVHRDGTVYGYEALARWDYQGQPVPPEIFIALAERSGLLPTLDMIVIQRAVAAIDTLPAGTDPPVLTVNVGLSHLPDEGLVPALLDLLARQGISPHRLVIEIPEDRSIEDPAVMRTLNGLRAAGVRLALDDFGIGYSSLGRMAHLRPDLVKLDRSFVSMLEASPHSREMIAAVIDLAHRMGARVIAEGVETAEQLAVVRTAGADAVQGFLLGAPTEPARGALVVTAPRRASDAPDSGRDESGDVPGLGAAVVGDGACDAQPGKRSRAVVDQQGVLRQ